MAHTTARPMITATLPAKLGPSVEEASPKLWQKAAPHHHTQHGYGRVAVAAAGQDQLPQGQPPSSTEPRPTSTMPKKFHNPSVWATA